MKIKYLICVLLLLLTLAVPGQAMDDADKWLDDKLLLAAIEKADGQTIAGSTQETFTPDADPETNSVDGWTWVTVADSTWDYLHDTTNGSAGDSAVTASLWLTSDGASNEWLRMPRPMFIFDTSGIPDGATITAATLRVKGSSRSGTAFTGCPNINVTSASPASDTALAGTDFDNVGSTNLCDTDIAFSSFHVDSSTWNEFELNATGLANISKTGTSGFAIRYDCEIDDVEPTWAANQSMLIAIHTAESAYDPELVVTYTD
jgi:hypothetical protein